MTKRLLFAANWKMHLGPTGAAAFLDGFLPEFTPRDDREVWLFPPALTLPSVVARVAGTGIVCGAQNVHWEEAGAFTGEVSVPLAADAGAEAVLIGHSERRHVFGETDKETGLKLRASLTGGLRPVFCVGETLDERESGATVEVVTRQLGVLAGLTPANLSTTVIAYEPVWAIGTGKTATTGDAARVHSAIREWMIEHAAPPEAVRVLYGGSVKPGNVVELVAEAEIDGVLVGGASLKAESWSEIVNAHVD